MAAPRAAGHHPALTHVMLAVVRSIASGIAKRRRVMRLVVRARRAGTWSSTRKHSVAAHHAAGHRPAPTRAMQAVAPKIAYGGRLQATAACQTMVCVVQAQSITAVAWLCQRCAAVLALGLPMATQLVMRAVAPNLASGAQSQVTAACQTMVCAARERSTTAAAWQCQRSAAVLAMVRPMATRPAMLGLARPLQHLHRTISKVKAQLASGVLTQANTPRTV